MVAQAYQTNHRGQRVDREVTRLFSDGLGRRLVKELRPQDRRGRGETDGIRFGRPGPGGRILPVERAAG